MKELYFVYADVWTHGYGTCIQLVEIYDTRQEADKAIVNAKNENPMYKLYGKTVELNKRYPLLCHHDLFYVCETEEQEKELEKVYQQVVELAWYAE